MELDETPQTLTTNDGPDQIYTHIDGNNGHTSVDENQINAYEYCQQVLQTLRLATERLQPALVNYTISARTADECLKRIEMIQATSSHSLGELFQTAVSIFQDFQLRCNSTGDSHTDQVGQEPYENSGRIASDPGEPSIQEFIQTPITTMQDKSLSTSQTRTTIEVLKPVKLEIINQPKQYRKKRTIRCLMDDKCPIIQGRGEGQRNYIQIKVKLSKKNIICFY